MQTHPYISSHRSSASHSSDWQRLCNELLPLGASDGFWRQSRALGEGYPKAGWKLHLSATARHAVPLLQRVGPLLQEKGVPFKAVKSMTELLRLNCGLFYGFAQVGKCMTVYPKSESHAVELAQRLHRLTEDLDAPPIPFDRRLCEGSSVFYRYGSFVKETLTHEDGTQILVMEGPEGKAVPDERALGKAVPDWLSDPFQGEGDEGRQRGDLLRAGVLVYGVLAQRGKGGVYRGIDVQGGRPRPCVLKQGRRYGEEDFAGIDGRWLVANEFRVLEVIAKLGLQGPAPLRAFEIGENLYAVQSVIEGENLQFFLGQRPGGLGVNAALNIAAQVATWLDHFHAAGWTWRDLKPGNLIRQDDGSIIPLDFEGALHCDDAIPNRWGTPGYIPPGSRQLSHKAHVAQDLYGLLATFRQLITGEIPVEQPPEGYWRFLDDALGSERLEACVSRLTRGDGALPSAREVWSMLADLAGAAARA